MQFSEIVSIVENGYNVDETNQYIAMLQDEYRNAVTWGEDLETQVEELKQKNSTLYNNCLTFAKKIKQLKLDFLVTDLPSAGTEVPDAASLTAEHVAREDALRKEISDLRINVNNLLTENNELKEKFSGLDNAAREAENADRQAAEEALNEAKVAGEQIKDEARAQSKQLILEAQGFCEQIKETAQKEYSELLERATEDAQKEYDLLIAKAKRDAEVIIFNTLQKRNEELTAFREQFEDFTKSLESL